MNDEIVELKAIVKGEVQGVFFRATVKEHASHFSISGYAKNLADGSVEITAQGTKRDLESFVQNIKKNPGRGKIDNISSSYHKPTDQFTGFKTL